jgi:hypothetical protein
LPSLRQQRRRRTRVVFRVGLIFSRVVALVVCVIAISFTTVALAARTLPAFPTFPYTTKGLRVRPARILTTPTAGGPELVGNVHYGPIKWRSWTARSAAGAGVVVTDSGKPDLVGGYKPAATATFELSDPGILGGRLVFHKLRLKEVKRIRRGNPLYGFHGLTVKLGTQGYYFAY